MLNFRLHDYCNAYISIKGTVTVEDMSAAANAANNTNKKIIIKNCAPFTKYIGEINNIEIDNARGTDVVIRM